MIVEWKNTSKQNKVQQLTTKNYTLKRAENFKYLGVIFNEDNKHQINLQERIQNVNKTYFMPQKYYGNKNISKKLELRLNRQNFNICIRNLDTKKETESK